ncbi:RNA polymerase sigma factor [Alkalilimnicola ehrlichii]|nr:RNA polymerase sigma factor [Alkalilimnicola ehrlichii]
MSRLIRLWQRLSPAAAFDACVQPHIERLWRLAVRFQGNPSDAEDLMQDLLERAWQRREEIQQLDAPGPWLAKVLYRLHIDRWRRQGVHSQLVNWEELEETSDLMPAVSEEQAVLTAIAASEVLAAVDRLPEAQRAALLLHDGEGYTVEEVATIVDVPVGTVKSRLHRARAGVRHHVAEGTKSPPAACIEMEGPGEKQ